MIQITINEKLQIRNLPQKEMLEITKAFTIENPEYLKRIKMGKKTWGVDRYIKLYARIIGGIELPANCLWYLQMFLTHTKYEITDMRQEGMDVDFGEWNKEFKLRTYQEEAVELAIKSNGVIVSPAGSGKTIMGMNYIHSVGKAALWIVHTLDLAHQAKERAEATMLGVGKIGQLYGGTKDLGDGKLIIATIQTLQKTPAFIHKLNQFIGTLIVDEAHHTPSPFFLNVLTFFKTKKMLGLTATPDRKDNLQSIMYHGLGEKLIEIDRKYIYDNKKLIKPEIKFVYTDFYYSSASKVSKFGSVDAGGESLNYHEVLSALFADQKRKELIVKNIVDNAEGNYSIVLGDSIDYLIKIKESVEEELIKRGLKLRAEKVHSILVKFEWKPVKTIAEARRLLDNGEVEEIKRKNDNYFVKYRRMTDEYYDKYKISPKERIQILKDMKDKKIHILFATKLAREGLDYPHLNIGHKVVPNQGDDSRYQRNGAAIEQEIGRIMRVDPKNPDKKAIWFDYVDHKTGVFKNQYNGRRRVYKRLGLEMPRKQKDKADSIEEFLMNCKVNL